MMQSIYRCQPGAGTQFHFKVVFEFSFIFSVSIFLFSDALTTNNTNTFKQNR